MMQTEKNSQLLIASCQLSVWLILDEIRYLTGLATQPEQAMGLINKLIQSMPSEKPAEAFRVGSLSELYLSENKPKWLAALINDIDDIITNQSKEHIASSTKKTSVLLDSIFNVGANHQKNKPFMWPNIDDSSGYFPQMEGREIAQAKLTSAYKLLVKELNIGLDQIIDRNITSWQIWSDSFLQLWQSITQFVPAKSAEQSLFHTSKLKQALATAIWRYLPHQELTTEASPEPWIAANKEKSISLIQGDFYGIQEFIFAHGGESQKQAHNLLRGRSFFISLVTELVLVKLLDSLSLPSNQVIINAAGKFLVIAPNIPATQNAVEEIKREMENWSRKHTHYMAGLGLTTANASPLDLSNCQTSSLEALLTKLYQQQDIDKYQRLNLLNKSTEQTLHKDYINAIDTNMGVCALDGRSPATIRLNNSSTYVSELSNDCINLGKALAQAVSQPAMLLITDTPTGTSGGIAVLGYHYTIAFSTADKSFDEADLHSADRVWDIGLKTSTKANSKDHTGYARRYINAYIPTHEYPVGNKTNIVAKTFEQLANANINKEQQQGITALMCLKGDIDDLGALFQRVSQQGGLPATTALSNQIDRFFTLYLPKLCAQKFPDVYTVFAGGDDFFLIGPWRSTIDLSMELVEQFARYTGSNKSIHFSIGLIQQKPKTPILHIANMAEEALEKAKLHPGKNAVCIYGQPISWGSMLSIISIAKQMSDFEDHNLSQTNGFSTAYLYGLLDLARMAEESEHKPEAAMWRSYLVYRTRRNVTGKESSNKFKENGLEERLLHLIGNGIATHKRAFSLAIHYLLYQARYTRSDR